jgi:molecular chaperone GrpE
MNKLKEVQVASKDKEKKSGSTASLHQTFSDENPEAVAAQDMGLLDHPSYIELQNKLTEAEEKANQYWDRMLRMQAETENIQRRVERDVANAHKYGLEKFILELLPVIDSLERALTLTTDKSDPVLQGVEMTLKMFYGVLEKFSVQQVNPEQQAFNPEQHQAVSTQVDPSVKSGTVLSVLQKGYLLNNRLIRPALVVVSKSE